MKRARRRRQVHVRHNGQKNRTGEQRTRMRMRFGIRNAVREVRRQMGQEVTAWWVFLFAGGQAMAAFDQGVKGRAAAIIADGPRYVDQPPELRADFEAGFGRARREVRRPGTDAPLRTMREWRRR